MMPNPSIHNCMDGGHQNATPERRGAVERRGGAAGGRGPLVGGALVQVADWRLAFVVNVPLGLIAIAAARSSVAEAQSKRAERMPDLFGSALLASAAGLLAWTLVDGNNWGWLSARTGLTIAGALVLEHGWCCARGAMRPPPSTSGCLICPGCVATPSR